MPRIKKTFNNGKSASSTPIIEVGSLNVSPNTVTGSPTVTEIDASLLEDFDTFTIENDSATTDFIVLPAGLAIGTVVYFIITEAVRLGVRTESINGGTANNAVGFTLSSGNGLIQLTKVSATNWTCTNLTGEGTAGTVAASLVIP